MYFINSSRFLEELSEILRNPVLILASSFENFQVSFSKFSNLFSKIPEPSILFMLALQPLLYWYQLLHILTQKISLLGLWVCTIHLLTGLEILDTMHINDMSS